MISWLFAAAASVAVVAPPSAPVLADVMLGQHKAAIYAGFGDPSARGQLDNLRFQAYPIDVVNGAELRVFYGDGDIVVGLMLVGAPGAAGWIRLHGVRLGDDAASVLARFGTAEVEDGADGEEFWDWPDRNFMMVIDREHKVRALGIMGIDGFEPSPGTDPVPWRQLTAALQTWDDAQLAILVTPDIRIEYSDRVVTPRGPLLKQLRVPGNDLYLAFHDEKVGLRAALARDSAYRSRDVGPLGIQFGFAAPHPVQSITFLWLFGGWRMHHVLMRGATGWTHPEQLDSDPRTPRMGTDLGMR